MKQLLHKLIDFWRRRRFGRPHYRHISYYTRHSDLPDSIGRSTISVVGDPARPKWAAFECPCGRGHRIVINLSQSRHPSWSLDPTDLTVYPSIDAYEIDRCHFWIRDGRVTWT